MNAHNTNGGMNIGDFLELLKIVFVVAVFVIVYGVSGVSGLNLFSNNGISLAGAFVSIVGALCIFTFIFIAYQYLSRNNM